MAKKALNLVSVCIARPPEGGFLAHVQTGIERLGILKSLSVTISNAANGANVDIGDSRAWPVVSHPPNDAEILVSGRPSQSELDACPSLRHVIVPYAGVPAATIALIKSRPSVRLHNLHHNAIPTSEHAVALLMAAAKRVVPIDRAMRLGDWTARYEENRGMILGGRRALVVGWGAIGRRVGAALGGLGMSVAGVRGRGGEGFDASMWPGEDPVDAGIGRSIAPTPVFRAGDLAAMLPLADVVMVCVPATAATEGLLGARELALLPKHAILVNVARGAVVDEAALFDALVGGRLAAAGLDVWWVYPKDEASRASTMPSRLAFHELENVVMSPHRAGHGDRTEELRAGHLVRLLAALVTGDVDANRVDLDAGY